MATDTIIWVVNRKTLLIEGLLENFIKFSYKQNWRKFGVARLEIDAVHMTKDMIDLLRDGNFGLLVRRAWLDESGFTRHDEFLGYCVKWEFNRDNNIKISNDITQMCNEAILLTSALDDQGNPVATPNAARTCS